MVELSVVARDSTWGNGLAPPNGITKLIGFTCVKIPGPTFTTTETVAMAVPVAARNKSWPRYVPAMRPPPGRLVWRIFTVILFGVLKPLSRLGTNHAPPSAVLG